MLSSSGLRHDAALSHAHGQERLPQRVVDLVRPGVRQVFAFEEDPRTAAGGRQARRFVDRGRSAGVMLQETGELRQESLVVAGLEVGPFEHLDRLDERFGNEPPTELAEVATGIGVASRDSGCRYGTQFPGPISWCSLQRG